MELGAPHSCALQLCVQGCLHYCITGDGVLAFVMLGPGTNGIMASLRSHRVQSGSQGRGSHEVENRIAASLLGLVDASRLGPQVGRTGTLVSV